VAQSIYITSAEGQTGKSTIALGTLDTLSHEVERVGVFRPIARSITERDYVVELLRNHDSVSLDYDECIGVTYDEVHADAEAALATIVRRYKAVEAQCDSVAQTSPTLAARPNSATTLGSPQTSAPRCSWCSAVARARVRGSGSARPTRARPSK
jgi:BioD-like phosphotransacetylase family protein